MLLLLLLILLLLIIAIGVLQIKKFKTSLRKESISF